MSGIPGSEVLDSVNLVSAAALAALLNSLWQAAAVAAAAWLVMRFTPRMNAATRHIVWWAVLGVVVLLPLMPAVVGTWQAQPAAAAAAESALPLQTAALPVVLEAPGPASPVRQDAPAQPVPVTVHPGAWASWIMAAWAAALLLQLGRVAWSYRYLRQAKGRARLASAELRRNFDAWMMSCRVSRPARLLVSAEISSPMAVGFRHPAVILPERLLNEFQECELDHVLLHELAHIARNDDWTNLAARLAGGVLALHPVAAWVLRRIEQEREIACDDWVVSMTGAARPYAASLARLFEVCFARRRMMLASGMAGNASHLGQRIELLLRRSREFAPRASAARIALSLAALVVLVVAAAQAPRWIAFAQDQAPPAAPEAAQAPAAPSPVAAPVAPQALDAPAAAAPQNPPVPPAAAAPEALPAPAVASAPPTAPIPPAARPYIVGTEGAQLRSLREQLAAVQRDLSPSHPRMQQLLAQIREVETAIEQQQRASTSTNHSGSFLAALVAAGYGNLSVDEIIELKNAGISAEYLRGIGEAGWGKLSVAELISLAQRGVTPDYVRRMKDAGVKDLTLKDVMSLSEVGARPEVIREIHALGFGPYTARQAIQFSQMGTGVELFRALKDGGYASASPSDIIEAQTNGVSAHDLREAKQYGSTLTLKQVIKLKTAGVL